MEADTNNRIDEVKDLTSDFMMSCARMTTRLEDTMKENAQLRAQLTEALKKLDKAEKTMAFHMLAMDEAHRQIETLKDEVVRLRSEHGNEVVTAMYYAQIIPLSKPAARQYVVKIDNNRDRFCIAHFLQQTLANDIPQQLADEVRQMTQLPEPKADAPRTVNNHFEAGSSSQVMNGPINNSTFNTPPTE